MTEPLPRPIAGLSFQQGANGVIESLVSEGFWALWRHNPDALRALGFRPKKFNEGSKNAFWRVLWSPGKVAADVVDDALEDLQLALFASQRKTSEHDAEITRRQREIEQEQYADRNLRLDIARDKMVARFGEQSDADLAAAAKAAGRACWSQWHNFCVQKRKFTAFIGDAQITLGQAVWLLDLVDQTEAKAAKTRDNLVSSEAAVDWSDDEVVRAVETLTLHDSDQASEENGLGWSKADSSRGHWCRGMIRLGGADRDIGIDAARNIVGKYSLQLQRGEAA